MISSSGSGTSCIKASVLGYLYPTSSDFKIARDIAEKTYVSGADSDLDSESSESTDSGSEFQDEKNHNRQRTPKVCMLVQLMQAQIRSLYDVSFLLRRPMVKDKYIRSHADRENRTIVDETSLHYHFRPFDMDYVWERIGQWHRQTNSERHNAASSDQHISTTSIENDFWFLERLATANNRRREQIQYWKTHTAEYTHPSSSNLPQSSQRDQKDVEAEPSRAKQTPASIISLSTVPRSYIHDLNAGDRLLTVYEPTIVGKTQSNRVPDIPELAKTSGTFPCPYCGMKLISKEMQSRGLWKLAEFILELRSSH
jgi:hypothetical protein